MILGFFFLKIHWRCWISIMWYAAKLILEIFHTPSFMILYYNTWSVNVFDKLTIAELPECSMEIHYQGNFYIQFNMCNKSIANNILCSWVVAESYTRPFSASLWKELECEQHRASYSIVPFRLFFSLFLLFAPLNNWSNELKICKYIS